MKIEVTNIEDFKTAVGNPEDSGHVFFCKEVKREGREMPFINVTGIISGVDKVKQIPVHYRMIIASCIAHFHQELSEEEEAGTKKFEAVVNEMKREGYKFLNGLIGE